MAATHHAAVKLGTHTASQGEAEKNVLGTNLPPTKGASWGRGKPACREFRRLASITLRSEACLNRSARRHAYPLNHQPHPAYRLQAAHASSKTNGLDTFTDLSFVRKPHQAHEHDNLRPPATILLCAIVLSHTSKIDLDILPTMVKYDIATTN